jgi:hypothetical protein
MPSTDLPERGFSEWMTLEPLTKRFLKYEVPAVEFGSMFMRKAFGTRQPQGSELGGAFNLEMAG